MYHLHFIGQGVLIEVISPALISNQLNDVYGDLTNAGDDEAQTQTNQTDQTLLHGNYLDQSLATDQVALRDDNDGLILSSDLWSTAYRDAVDSLGEGIDIAILEGRNVAQLFRELEEMDKEATQESALLRGVKYLQSIQVPLERFKLALDLASPLTSLEPTTLSVFGVIRSVTAVSLAHIYYFRPR